jgi:Zn-dependent protease with chaperone function
VPAPAPAIALAAFTAACIPAGSALAAARWPRRSPAAAIVLWQALGLGWGLAAVGALAALGAADARSGVAGGAFALVARVMNVGRGTPGPQRLMAWTMGLRLVALAAGLVLLLLLCWILVAAFAAVLRARRRQRILLSLLAHGDPKVPGALVVDHPAATAYCVPGLRSRIVISAGALDLLDQAELAAVLAHERAHLRARHDLVLLPFAALLRAFGWSRAVREANRAVGLRVEMLADDAARRRLPARELATALLRVGTAGGGIAPAGALAAGGRDGELAARVSRLLRPQPGLPVLLLAVVVMVAALLAAGPAAAWLVPL